MAGETGSGEGKEAIGEGEGLGKESLGEVSRLCPQAVAVRKGESQFSPKMRHTVPPLARGSIWIMVGFLPSPHLLFITPCSDAVCSRGGQIWEMEFTEIKLTEGRNSGNWKPPFLSSQLHTQEPIPWSIFPLRKRLQFFGRAESFDWPPLLLFATKNPDQSSSAYSWFGSQQSCQVLCT